MNTINSDENSRPFGFWLKAVDRLMAVEFAAAFESEGITRREWRLLNIIDGAVAEERRKGGRPLPAHKLSRLIELGWVTDAEDGWKLTEDGRAAKERLGVSVDGIRAKVTDAVSADDLATTMTTLEQLARAFGWDESKPLPRGREGRGSRRGFGRGRGFGPGRRGFGHGFGADRDRFEHGFGGRRHGAPRDFAYDGGLGSPEMNAHADCHHTRPYGFGGPHSHRNHGGHPRERFARFAQGAYERGFDAGFSRARDER